MCARYTVAATLLLASWAYADFQFPACEPSTILQLGTLCRGTTGSDGELRLLVNVKGGVDAPVVLVSQLLDTPVSVNFTASLFVEAQPPVAYHTASNTGIVVFPSDYVPEGVAEAHVVLRVDTGVQFLFGATRTGAPLQLSATAALKHGDLLSVPYAVVVEPQSPFVAQMGWVDVNSNLLMTASLPMAEMTHSHRRVEAVANGGAPLAPFSAPTTVSVGFNATQVQPADCLFASEDVNMTDFTCGDGSTCEQEGCCAQKGNVQLCPSRLQMCEDPQGCQGQFCCKTSCKAESLVSKSCTARGQLSLAVAERVDDDDSSGISGGSVFLLILFFGTGLYCGCGVLYNYYQGTTQCPEVMPHHRFWVELPSFVGEGCVFLQTKLCGKPPEKNPYSGPYAPAPRTSMGQSQSAGESINAYGTGQDGEGETPPV